MGFNSAFKRLNTASVYSQACQWTEGKR